MIPIIATMGLNLGHTIAGTAVIETVFSWPGIGRLVVESVNGRDVTQTTGVVVMTTGLYVLVQLLADIAFAIVDPRIKAQFALKAKKRNRRSKRSSEMYAEKRQIIPIAAQTDASDDATGVLGAEDVTYAADLPATDVFCGDAPPMQADAAATVLEPEERVQEDGAYSAEQGAENSELIMRKYRKRGRVGEVFHHLSRNKGAMAGLVIIAIMLILFVVALCIPFSKVTTANVADRFSSPSLKYLFGTDGMGRNQFTRVIYATRFSMPIGLGATAFAALIGVFLGSLAAYYEGTPRDEVIMRFSDTLASIPGVLLGMVIITTLGRSLTNLIIAVGVAAIPGFIRMSRASMLSVKGNEFVEAARAIGLPNFRIIFSQILPNAIAPMIVAFTAQLGMSILISATLSFLGYGVPVPNPEWGSLAATGRDNISNAPWLTTFPGLFIMITVLSFTLLGDGLRDAFDPKLKKR